MITNRRKFCSDTTLVEVNTRRVVKLENLITGWFGWYLEKIINVRYKRVDS